MTPLRFFADHCIANAVVQSLRSAGHVVTRLKEELPVDAADERVIARAQSLKAILLTLNGDFTDIVSYPPDQYGGIVALRVRNHPEVTSRVTERLLAYLAAHSGRDEYDGKLLVVEPHQIRLRSA